MPPDPYKYFRVEGRQLLDELGRGALELERAPTAELVPKLLRFAHTLKGAARVVKQAEIATLAHAVEDVLGPLRTAPASRAQVDQLLSLFDRINALLAQLTPAEPRPAASAPAAALGETLALPAAEVGELDALLAGLSEAMVHVAALRRRGVETGQAKRAAERLGARLTERLAEQLGGAHGESDGRANLAAEDLQSQLAQLEERLLRGVELLQRELRQSLDTAERLRLLSAGTVFGLLERIARDAAHETGKQVTFRGEGGEIRLEAAVLLKVQRALVQLVRNAVAHGVENPAIRRKLGKPVQGTIDLRIVRRGSRVAFVCRDDGRGIDFASVKALARERGLVAAGQDPSPDELRAVLLAGGLSTSRQVTEVAGRGLGLDVVREELRALGGQVELRSTDGQGTEFELIVPVSLTSLETLMVEAAGQTVAIPLDAVRRAFRLSAAEVSTSVNGDQVVTENGQALPLLSLAAVLAGQAPPGLPSSAVVVSTGTSTVALSVDRVLGDASVVLRSLPQLVPGSLIAMGACLDEDGNPRLVLDETRLTEAVRLAARPPAAVSKRRPILVVDDSVTTRMLEQSILESAGYEVALASSAEEGLEMARRQAYGLFLVDVEMPGMDGFSFVQHTRSESRLRDTPAILVTSRNAPEDRQRGRDVGALSYIVKSAFDQGELLELVRRTVG